MKRGFTAALILASALGLVLKVPRAGERLLRYIPWETLEESKRRRYLRWLRRHRKRLWGRDFDDGDGTILDRLPKVVRRTGDETLVRQVFECLNEPTDADALAKMHRVLDEAEERARLQRLEYERYGHHPG